MKIVADLHLHSKYSRAVSPQMEPRIMAQWAFQKGIDLIATSDWTHPLWLKELEGSLEETGEGIFRLKGSLNRRLKSANTKKKQEPRFILSTEISSIYSQGGKGRRIHNLVYIPSFATAHKINDELKRRGCNLMSDGRPIIGLSSIELAELVWSVDEDCLIIPAHCWTPWFALYGSKSGFDSIEECYGKFSDRIYAIETGLSSDPAMNWRIKDLETRSIVSFSDAHSPAKLGREATVFQKKTKNQKPKTKNTNLNMKKFSFNDLAGAIKQDKNSDWEIAYTIEFHPEEGKYHYTGHRNCGVKHSPEETKSKGTTCSVCGRALTLGVMHRVEELAGYDEFKPLKKESEAGLIGYYHPKDKSRPPYVMLVPLMEILAESFNIGVQSQRVKNEYENLTKNLGSEFDILTSIKIEEIKSLAGEKAAQGVQKARKGDIVIDPGFDGVFGTVKIWSPEKTGKEEDKDLLSAKEQMSLF